jgi:outer membrane protein
MNRQLKNLWITLAALLLFPAAAAWAQAGAAGNKVGVINIRQAIVTTAEGKQASSQLQAQFDPQQNDLQNMQKQIQTLQERLNNGARTLSADEQAKLQRQGELLAREFQRKQDDLNEEVTAAQGDIVDTIGRKMVDVIEKYSKDNGFVVVLDSSAQGTPVVYGATQADITQEIIRLYDQAYPLKAGSSSAEPSRPAGTTTAPKPATSATPPAASRPVTPAPPAQAPAKKPTP